MHTDRILCGQAVTRATWHPLLMQSVLLRPVSLGVSSAVFFRLLQRRARSGTWGEVSQLPAYLNRLLRSSVVIYGDRRTSCVGCVSRQDRLPKGASNVHQEFSIPSSCRRATSTC